MPSSERSNQRAIALTVELATALATELIGAEGKPVATPDGRGLYSCAAVYGIALRWQPAPGPAWLHLYFAGVATTDTWNSWIRAPQLPAASAIHLDGAEATARRFAVRLDATAAMLDGTLIELALPPQIAQAGQLLVELIPGPYLLQRVALQPCAYEGAPLDDQAAPDQPFYPLPQPHLPSAGDALADQLRALASPTGEPTLTDVWRLALPYRGGALLGAVEKPVAAQLWDGGLLWSAPDSAYTRTWLRIRGPGDVATPRAAEQGLRHGYLPVGQVRLQQADGTIEQTAFVDLDGTLRVRVQRDAAGTLRFEAARAGFIKSQNNPRAQACHCTALPVETTQTTLRIGSTQAQLDQRAPTPDCTVVDLRIPLTAAALPDEAASFDEALRAVEQEAAGFLARGAQLDLPDPHLHNAWRALLLHNRLFQRGGILRYGVFPSVYDGGLFGVEEGWNIVAMAQYGHAELAQALLARTFFDPEFLKKEGQHHQYRSGLCITYARDVHALTGDTAALRALWPLIADNAEWIAAAFRSTQELLPNGERPVHYGLMPKHTYGGDLTDPTYSLYGSSAAWRGLRDAALLAPLVGDGRGEQWARAAAQTQNDLHIAAGRIYRADATPPFLPFRTDEPGTSPSAGDYHQLFASLILETAVFGWHGRWAQSITDYLQATGRQTLGVARFDQWFGRLGVDAEYSRGTQLCALHRRDFDRFYLGLLGQLGLSCDPYTFVSPETAIVRFSRTDHQDRMRTLAEQPARFDSDPCSAGTAVMLQYLRCLLVMEERDESDLPTGTLWLGAGAPRSWFAPGQRFAAQALPTAFGPVSLRCETDRAQIVYHLELPCPLAVEVFYFDGSGQRCSKKLRVAGAHTLSLLR
jgi:hypothetical protein